ncbi:MAG: hypothetical protein EHM87_02740 [Burkholderiales bacterium]|nr:MAG: hypothetical protein EHM87_02740 [Burkholderiales bacterium]
MSQTLAQRRALAARGNERTDRPDRPACARGPAPAADRDARAPPGAADDARAPPPGSTDDAGRFRPDSGAAGRAILTLVRAGARVVDVGPERVLLRRGSSDCEVDRSGRVAWRRR